MKRIARTAPPSTSTPVHSAARALSRSGWARHTGPAAPRCAALGQHRSTQRKVPRGREDAERLSADVVELARQYGRYGYRKVAALLRQAGWSVSDGRVERIWRREGLKVPQKQPKRGRLWLTDGSCIRLRPERPNHVWSYDFVEDRTHDGRRYRMLNVIDEFTHYLKVAATANCGRPAQQYNVALVDWRRRTFRALETTLDWLVDFLMPDGVLVIWTNSRKLAALENLRLAIAKRGFVIEDETLHQDGYAVSARRPPEPPVAKAALPDGVIVARDATGEALYATLAFAAGDTVFRFQDVSWRPERDRYTVEHPDGGHLFDPVLARTAHSCDANCRPSTDLMAMIARREIAVGEPITFDCATTERAIRFPFDCVCGAPACRGRIE